MVTRSDVNPTQPSANDRQNGHLRTGHALRRFGTVIAFTLFVAPAVGTWPDAQARKGSGNGSQS
jgi:hypothetical protein